ncbi:universal stress protein [Arthrobacter sp. EpRS71]|uniref:universal stress protein n=1 Tax=Arthrobacter sp. EpRS71 TaxID=1743141 RepID=UPI000748298D|nr:universal stress protein [Arthrobacter sp. EpRS71]KUM36359.1 universal stress protein UspA [Arthrobacter sp. EpRS71]
MTIVVGYIPTPEGNAALEHAIDMARRDQKLLLVINSSRGDAYVDDRQADDLHIKAIQERLARDGVDHLIRHPIRGRDAVTEVLEAAQEYGAELIVIGLRRRTPVGKLIMGSTAQGILLEASCPVLAVKAHTDRKPRDKRMD